MPNYTFSPYDKLNPPVSSSPNTAGETYRIRQTIKPTIVLDELSLKKRETPDSKQTRQLEDFASMEFPLIKINDYMVGVEEIDYFKIDSGDRAVPTITITLSFSNDLFMTKNLPKDGDMISVAIMNKSNLLNPIRNDYIITGVSPLKKSTTIKKALTVTFFGQLFIPGFSNYKGNVAFNMTSMEALKTIAKQLGLGFATNEESTDDKQIWIITTAFDKTIEEIVSRSWKDGNSFFDWWIDIYYNLNFVNVQKQLLSQEDSVDTAALLNNSTTEYTWGSQKDVTVPTPKVFSNYLGYRTTSFYITDWRPINKSSQITFDYGTSIQSTFFEHNDVLYRDPEKTKYWSFKIEPAYDKEKVNSHILLRGRAKWDPSINSNEPAKANYDFLELYNVSPWLGIQYTISNPSDENTKWTGNHHKNYLRAEMQNVLNLVELDKLNVEINVQGTNLNIIKGDKLPIVLVQKDRVENLITDPTFNLGEALEFFYTGWFYVKGFTLSWMRGTKPLFSNFSQSFLLTRREWPAPVPVDPVKPAPENNTI